MWITVSFIVYIRLPKELLCQTPNFSLLYLKELIQASRSSDPYDIFSEDEKIRSLAIAPYYSRVRSQFGVPLGLGFVGTGKLQIYFDAVTQACDPVTCLCRYLEDIWNFPTGNCWAEWVISPKYLNISRK